MRNLPIALFTLAAVHLSAQDWYDMMYRSDANLLDVVRAYNTYYQSHPYEKTNQTQEFKRWLRSRLYTVQANGDPYSESMRPVHRSPKPADAPYNTAQWRPVGPFAWDKEAAGIAHAPGLAHCYVVREHPMDSNVVVAGMATAGVWLSTNAGRSWTNTTQLMPVREVRAVTFHPSNPAIVVFGSANGIYTSRDTGRSWSPTSFVHDAFSDVVVHDLAVFGEGGTELLAATSRGLLRSTNGGTTFAVLHASEALEIERHPVDATTWYAVARSGESCAFLRSTDGGASFSAIGSGLPIPAANEHSRRWEIAVTPAAPNAVYLLAAGVMNGGEGLVGVYHSSDRGSTWQLRCCGDGPGGAPTPQNPNMMHWDPDGQKPGGQYYYDLALAVSPVDANRVYVAGINVWVSSDGGRSFVCNAKWTWEPEYIPRYVHADVHEITTNGHRVWVASDGGTFLSLNDGIRFEDRSDGLVGTDFWGWGQGFDDCDVMLGGTYHNGVMLKDGDVYRGWLQIYGSDNGGGLVNFADSRTAYADVYLGEQWQRVRLSGKRDVSPQREGLNIVPTSPIVLHPNASHELWAGTQRGIQRSTDHGRTWHIMSSFGDTTMRRLVIPVHAPNVVLALGKASFWDTFVLKRSDDGGETFSTLPIPQSLLAGNGWRVMDVVTSLDATTIVVAIGGRQTRRKVIRSDDGGITWRDWSEGLEAPSAISLAISREPEPTVYVGTEHGVYARMLNASTWSLLGTGLPMGNCNVLSLCERNGLLRTATSRGVWELPIARSQPPVAVPSVAERVVLCTSDSVRFFDHSAVDHATVQRMWTFEGGTPSTSELRTPVVTYARPGTYPVRLTVTDVHGTNTHAIQSFITVVSNCQPALFAGNALVVGTPEQSAVAPGAALSTRNFTITSWIRRQGAQADFAGIVFTRSPGTATGISINSDGRLRYHAGDAGWWIVPQHIVPDNTWCHVALAVRNDTAWLAVNGRAERFVVRHPDVIANADVHIGRDPTGSRTFRGAIDEVRLYSRALTIDEIRAAMYLTNPDTSGLRAHYQFEHGQALAADVVGGRHASLPDSARLVASGAPVSGGRSKVVRDAKNRVDFAPVAVRLETPGHPGALLVVQYDDVTSMPPTTSERGIRGGELIIESFEPDTMERPLRIDVGRLSVGPGEQERPTNVRMYVRPIVGATAWSSPVGQARSVTAQDSTATFAGGFFFTTGRRLLITTTEPETSVAGEPALRGSVRIRIDHGTVHGTWRDDVHAEMRLIDLRGRVIAYGGGHGGAVLRGAPLQAGTYVVSVTTLRDHHVLVVMVDEWGNGVGLNNR